MREVVPSGRWLRVGVAATVVAGVSFVAAGAASAATATLTATPHANLTDGQAVTVTASGYPANVGLDLVECDMTHGCDLSNIRVFPSGPNGGYTTTYFVSRIIRPGGTPVDCAITGTCELVSIDYTTLAAAAFTPITFNPNAPLAPPLALSMSLAGTDGVTSTGVAVLHGNVTCNRGAALSIFASLYEVQHGVVGQGEGDTSLLCPHAGTFSWQSSVLPYNQLFVRGPAQATVDINASTGSSYVDTSATGTVLLTPATLPVLVMAPAAVTAPVAGTTSTLQYRVHLSVPSRYPVTFTYTTLNGSAFAPRDFVATSGQGTIPAGSTSTTVPVVIKGNHDSAGTRRFVVSLTNPTNAVLGAGLGRGTVTITHT